MVAGVGFKQTHVDFDRPERFAGETKYNRFTGSIRVGLHGIFSYSSKPLALAWFLGFGMVGLSLILGISYCVWRFALGGGPFEIEPITPLVVVFVGGVQILSVAILGEYIGRIYDEVKSRPRFIVDRVVGLGSKGTEIPHAMSDTRGRSRHADATPH